MCCDPGAALVLGEGADGGPMQWHEAHGGGGLEHGVREDALGLLVVDELLEEGVQRGVPSANHGADESTLE